MRRLAWGALGLIAAALLGVAVWRYAYEVGRQDAAYMARTDTVRVEIRRLDTLYRTDTLRLWRLVRQVDTVVQIDSIPVIASDSARADSSLRLLRTSLSVCASAVSLCEQRVAAERRLRQLAESAAVARQAPSPRRPARAFVAGALAGVATVLLLRR